MRVIQTVPLTAGVSTSSGLHWSEEDKLCAVTNKGLLIYELIPNPCFTGTHLNWRKAMIPNPERGNPYLHDVGIDRDVLMNELSLDDKELLIATHHLYPQPEAGKPPLRLVEKTVWAPKEAFPAQSSLVTLTDDFWLKVMVEDSEAADGSWKVAVDLSQLLHQTLKSEKWKGCSEVCDKPKKEISAFKQRLNDLRGRTFAQAVTAFAWGGITCKKGAERKSILVTSSKSGLLAFWSFSATDGNSPTNVKLSKIHKLDGGEVRVINTRRVKSDEFLMFLGGVDGRVTSLRVHYTASRDAVTVKELGCVWNKADRASVSVICVAGDALAERRSLRLLFAKSLYVVICDVDVSGDAVKVTGKWAARTGGFNIVDVLPLGDGGGGEYLVMRERGPPQTLSIQDDLRNCSLGDLAAPSLDTERFQCHGVKMSGGGAIYAVLQSVCVYYDHLVLRTPGRLSFVTPFSAEELSERLSGGVGGGDVPDLKDSLEVYRVLCASNDKLEVGRRQHFFDNVLGGCDSARRRVYIWLARMFEVQGNIDLREVIDALCKEALVADAKDRLKSEGSQKFKELKKFVDHREFSDGDWRCTLCDSGVRESNHEMAVCSEGHRWPRCCITMKICDEASLLSCRWCGGAVARDLQIYGATLPRCPLCRGPMGVQVSCFP